MAGFIMTLDSDDDTPRSPSPPPVLTSRSKAPSKPAPPAKPTAQSNKLTKKQRQKQKRADVGLTPAGLDDSDEDDAQAAPTPGAVDPDGAKMDKGFVFDGFGGGFVGRDRNSVWVRSPLVRCLDARSTRVLTPLSRIAGLGRGLHPEATQRNGAQPCRARPNPCHTPY